MFLELLEEWLIWSFLINNTENTDNTHYQKLINLKNIKI